MDVSKVAFSSSMATDKIVGVFSGSFNTNTAPTLGGYIAYTSFAHPFGRPVFCKMQSSSDGSNWKDENSTTVYSISYSTDAEIFVLHAPSNGVIQYRITAFWIDDYDSSEPFVSPTIGSLSRAYFDSRLNYQKVYTRGVLTIPAATLSTSNIISHNLGYKPNVRVYNEMIPGQVWPATYGGGFFNYWMYDFAMVEAEVKVWDDTLEINSFGGVSSPATRVWYTVYHDD